MCSKNTMVWKENAKQRELLQTQKKRKTRKQVVLKGKFVFSTQGVLEIAREAEKVTAEKGTHIQRCKVPTNKKLEQQEDELVKDISSNSDSDSIVIMQHKQK